MARITMEQARRAGLVVPAVRRPAVLPTNLPPLSDVGDNPPMPTQDLSRYLREIPVERVVAQLVHQGEPVSKQRPRFSAKNRRVYTPLPTRLHEQAIADLITPVLGGVMPDADWAFGIRAVFHVQTYHRKDVDNMLKVVLDAMNRLVFQDDSQVEELMGWKCLDVLAPRTEFVVYRIHKLTRDTGACVRCGKTFRTYRSWKLRRFCSRACRGLAQQTAVEMPCAGCGKLIVRTPCQKNKGSKVYCSTSCFGVVNRRAVACATCGSSINRPRSFARDGQTAFYCSVACHLASRTGKPMSMTATQLSDRARKAWVTRRAKAAIG